MGRAIRPMATSLTATYESVTVQGIHVDGGETLCSAAATRRDCDAAKLAPIKTSKSARAHNGYPPPMRYL